MSPWQEFKGFNAAYVAELYERYRSDPNSVEAATRAYFEAHVPAGEVPSGLSGLPIAKIVGAVNLGESIRKFGHLDAQLDPLESAPVGDPSLDPNNHGVTEGDLKKLPASLIVGAISHGKSNAWEVIQELRQVYCSSTGYDFAHLREPEERQWLQVAAESRLFRPPADPIDEIALLDRLTQEGAFENFLHRTFPGKTRFSIEGLGILIPVIDEVIARAAGAEFRNVLIGMAHRARLNVLAHVLKKPYAHLLAEFKDPLKHSKYRRDLGWTGDVKYHAGAQRAVSGSETVDMVIRMAPNPSHLEAVDPVVEGMARAAGTRVDKPGAPEFDPRYTLPVLIHGDASFPGQGVVEETLNLHTLPGYTTGGTIHIIANNQVGFTTDPIDDRSTPYASGVARGFRIPIVHINADDPEACLEAARMAIAYRARFQHDFLIDLIGYRRYGHNEGDEPSVTQPLMYRKIANHPTVRQIWARTLRERGVIQEGLADELVRKHQTEIQAIYESLEPERQLLEPLPTPAPRGLARNVRTDLEPDRLRKLNEALLVLPEGFAVNRKLARARERRRKALDDAGARTIDWATAEELAFASILEDGVSIRLTGQDVERGTFNQRHAVFFDAETNARHVPLQSIPQAKAAFEVHNSPLSENAVLGFEYGYNVQEPGRLILWEAQYGDFVNGAQTVIDEFIVSARAKWGLTPSLVMLLPHGLEGQGPDHASARPERFLQLGAAINLRLAYPTTAAQYFHLLRRQALLLKSDPLPLIILTPKSLLRHPRIASSLRELADGRWNRVFDDEQARERASQVRRLILCSGKIYVDLVTTDLDIDSSRVAICRLEQLYPFPEQDIPCLFEGWPSLEEVVWVQEEPRNMGAWEFLRLQLARVIDGRWPLRYIGRPRSSSPAEGSSAWHALIQETLVRQAYDLSHAPDEDTVILKQAKENVRGDSADRSAPVAVQTE